MLDHILELDHLTLIAGAVAVAAALMILLRWTGQRVVMPEARLALAGDGSFEYEIAGTEAHQPALIRIAGRSPSELGEECVAELVPTLTSAGELTAIAVYLEAAHVGEVAARDIPRFHAAMRGARARCDALVVIGDRSGGLHVKLDIVWPPRLV